MPGPTPGPRPLVVVGDALLDVDLVGRATRLTPDAPAPVVEDITEVRRPGGAALAAALAARQVAEYGDTGASTREVVLVAPVGDDADGDLLREAVAASGVRLLAVPLSGGTPVKRRIRVGDHSLVRLDSGDDGEPGEVPAEALELLAEAGTVLVSDYGRGITRRPEVRQALERAITGPRRVPVVWDPHPKGAAPVAGVRLATPNRDEARRFRAGLPERPQPPAAAGAAGHHGSDLAELSGCAADLVAAWRADAVVITLSERGALLSRGESSPAVIPAPAVRRGDPLGAGDRFASAAALALADGALTLEAVQDAVHAAAAFVAAGGGAAYVPLQRADATPAAPPTPELSGELPDELPEAVLHTRARGGTVVATGGCFDLLHAGHVATLEAARRLGDCLVVCLNSDASVRRLKGESRPLVPAEDRARVLAALTPVDAVVVFDEDTPLDVIRRLRPDVWAKGGDYAGAELPEAAVLREWGGQSVTLPYLRGRSTTQMVETAAARSRR